MSCAKIKTDDIALCIREYHKNGLISNGTAIKKNAGKLHKTNENIRHIIFIYLLSACCKKKFLLKLNETNRPDLLVFNTEKLQLILQGEDDLPRDPINKVVVHQDLGFRPKEPAQNKTTCKLCKKTFGSAAALRQHSKDKDHTLLIAKSNNKTWELEKFNKNKHLIVEVDCGRGNASETVSSFYQDFQFLITLSNNYKNAIKIIDMISADASVKSLVVIPTKTFALDSGQKRSIPITVKLPQMRPYRYPLLVNFVANGTEEFVEKYLVFQVLPKEFLELKPKAPYVEPKKVIKDLNKIIVPGKRKVVFNQFESKFRLTPYPLTKDYEHLFNSGMRPVNPTPSCQALLKKLKFLNLENPEGCLNVENYAAYFDVLLFLEEHQMQQDIRNYDTTSELRLAAGGKLFKLDVPELSENRPSLTYGDAVYISETGSSTKYEGFVHTKGVDYVELGLSDSFKPIFLPGKKFEIEFGFNRYTLKVEHQAIELVAKRLSQKALMSPDCPSVEKIVEIQSVKWFNPKLNMEQKNAVINILAEKTTKCPYIIFGPPGTGKTTTMAEAILQVHKAHPKRKILICAPSNDAVNVVLRRLLKQGAFSKMDILRFISLSYKMDPKDEDIIKYCNFAGGQFYYPNLAQMQKYKIVVSTLCNSARLYNLGIPSKHFDYLFIDEAGHATETETLIPISGLMVEDGRLTGDIIMVGDPKQLGPIIHSKVAAKFGYGMSMIERYMNSLDLYKRREGSYDKKVLTKLVRNYRSHPVLIELPKEEFYDNEFVSEAPDDIPHLFIGHEILRNRKFPMMFHHVDGVDQRESNNPSFFNLEEIKVVSEYLKKLINCRVKGKTITQKDIAIISPYRKQVLKLTEFCSSIGLRDMKIGSTEKLQGQESLIVIVSTVRSKPENVKHDIKYHLGFLKNPKRFNVVITRAKALLIIVGNGNLLKHDPLWRNFIKKCNDNNSVIAPDNVTTVGPSNILDESSDEEVNLDDIERGFELININADENRLADNL